MGLKTYVTRITFIDYLIKKKATGSLDTLARKNNLSRRSLAEILKEMKELGFPIKFDRVKNSYIYEEDGEMIKSLFLKYGDVLSRKEMKQTGSIENLCFSEKAIFRPCKEI
jgi:hypothetical protein